MDDEASGNTNIRAMKHRFRGFLPVVVDVETGGFDWNRHALLEIAAVPVDLDEAGYYILGETASAHLEPAPGTEIDPKSLEITGIQLDHPFRLAKPEREALDHVLLHGPPGLGKRVNWNRKLLACINKKPPPKRLAEANVVSCKSGALCGSCSSPTGGG